MPNTTPLLSVCMFLAVPLLAQRTPDVRVDLATTPGAAPSREVQLAQSGEAVYAVWLDARSGQDDVYFNSSRDGGATWRAQEVRLDTGSAPGTGRSTEVRIAAEGPLVCVVWTEAIGAPRIYFNRSFDGGVTWLPAPTQLDLGGPVGTTSQMPAIACVAGFVFVAWSEARPGGDADIYFDRSPDGGTTWLGATVRLDTGSAAGTYGSYSPRIAVAIPNVYVVWDDFRSPNHGIYCNRSIDLGGSWQPTDSQLNSAVAANGPASGLPQIAADGPMVYVCWSDGRFGAGDIFCQASSDFGVTWLATDVRVDVGNLPGSTRTGMATLAAAGATVHVAWRDSRNHANNGDIYYNRSVDGGLTFGASDVRLDRGSPIGASDSSQPQLAAAGPAVAAVWVDNRFGSLDILANTSADGGASWLPVDFRVDTGPGGSTSDSSRPALVGNGASFVAAWEDARSGQNADIYAGLVAGYQPYGAGTAGTGGAVPRLAGGSAPVLGATARLEFANGLGAAPCLLAIGLGPSSQSAQPFFGGTLLVNPAATLFLLLGGTPGQPGAGAVVFVPLPPNTGLLGLNANFQGLMLDSGAVQGVSMTNGLALWIG